MRKMTQCRTQWFFSQTLINLSCSRYSYYCFGNFITQRHLLCQGVTFKYNTNGVFVFPSHLFLSVLGHVCCVWQFWKGCGGAVAGLCSVCPVLSSLLCEQQSKYNVLNPLICSSLHFVNPHRLKPDIFCRSLRRCFVRAGAVWNVLCVRCVERLRTPPVFCCVMTVMSVIIPTAWIHPCTMSQRVVGSANGKTKNL